jgi:3-(3-hydroxy-phenyl)propionate hydroxylase
MPAPGNRTRWEFKLRPGETREQVERPEFVRALLRPWTGEAPVELERVAVYRFHARCAARFSVGRVFLVGDAAHLTPPFAGQGLVSGLRDASNLAWKLAAVVQGRAGPSVLESYDVERRPLARASIEMARLLGRLIMPRNLWMAALVHGLVRFLGILPFTRRLIGELEIKPVNRFASGLFAAAPRRRLGAGGLFPQALVREGDRLRLSDGLLGDAPTLVGLGFDPAEQLSDATLRRWRAIGGSCVQLCHRGQALHLGSVSRRAEDVSGAFLGASSSLGWAAVVRPDRVVMCEGTDCERLVTQALALLAAPQALAVADRSVRAEVAA